jgi:hypothetical protein
MYQSEGIVSQRRLMLQYMETDEQLNSLLSLVGVCEGGPSDLADNHDQYLRVVIRTEVQGAGK